MPEHAAVLAVAVPVAVFIATIFALYLLMARSLDRSHVVELVLALTLLVTAYLLARAGVPIGACLLLVALAPTTVVLGYELVGHRGVARALREAG